MWERPKRIEPGPGQESVWDYPRPPALEPVRKRIRVEFAGKVIADTTAAYRVCETSHAPAYYLPIADIDDVLVGVEGASFCEWKGVASYYDVAVGDRIAPRAAWTYHEPTNRFAPIVDHVAFYAGLMDRCWVGDDEVSPMDGDFYGGWITPDLVGPFKGAPGTRHW
jgi:uncharacterized protein (DUF427 family)